MEWNTNFAASGIRNTRLAAIAAVTAVLGSVFGSLPCLGQGLASKAANATVKSNSVAVYSEMDEASQVVRTLKKGAALILDFEIAGPTGDWCRVRLPDQKTSLGYAECSALDVQQSHEPQSGVSAVTGSAGEAGMNPGESQPAIHLSLSTPAGRYASAYDRIKNLVVHDDEIDTLKMETIDREAKSGTAGAMDRAALAHIAAGHFDLSQSESDKAIDQFGAAMGFASQNSNILFASLMYLGYVHLIRSEYGAARRSLVRAQKLNPNSATVDRLLGWSDYGLNRLNEAIAELQKAQSLQPNAEVGMLLAKVKRDQQTESDFHQRENSHFILRYEGEATPGLAEDILSALEGDFQTLRSSLGFTPAQPIAVILYTDQTFRDVTRAPKWSGAINDGRIRIPVQGLASVTPELARELRHELTHSFVRQMTDGRCPTWLNEGLAQYFEGRTSAQDAQILVTLYQKKKYVTLRYLEGPWMRFPTPLAVYAYGWSLAAVESIIANSGMYGIERLFTRLKEENSIQMALETALQLSYSDLELQTVQYLQKTYLH